MGSLYPFMKNIPCIFLADSVLYYANSSSKWVIKYLIHQRPKHSFSDAKPKPKTRKKNIFLPQKKLSPSFRTHPCEGKSKGLNKLHVCEKGDYFLYSCHLTRLLLACTVLLI